MTTHPFYNLCKSIHDNDVSLKSYAPADIVSFFTYFRGFLQIFNKPVKTSIFNRPPKIIKDCLDTVSQVVRECPNSCFTADIYPLLKDCFLILLHHQNTIEIRNASVRLFYEIATVLGPNSATFIQDVGKYVFEFKVIESVCPKGSCFPVVCDPELRIQVSDSIVHKFEHLKDNISSILSEMKRLNDSSTFLMWWNIVRDLVFKVAYRSYFELEGIPDEGCGILRPCPIDLHRLLIDFFNFLLSKPEQLLLDVLKLKSTPYIMFEALLESFKFYTKDPASVAFTLQMADLLTQSEPVLSYIHTLKSNLWLSVATALLYLLDDVFVRQPQIEEQISLITCKIVSVAARFYALFPNEDFVIFCSHVSDFHNSDTPEFQVHLAHLLFTTCVNLKISNPDVWKAVVRGGGQQKIVYLSTCAYTAAYCGFCIAPTLLGFSFDQLHAAIKAVQGMDNWKKEKIYDKFPNLSISNQTSFFVAEWQTFCPEQLIDQIKKMRVQPLTLTNWSKDECLVNSRAMLKAFDWGAEKNLDVQFSMFLVVESFIYPFLKLTQLFPPAVIYDKSFLIAEYSDILKACAAPSVENKSVALCSLKMLGDIFCVKSSIPFESQESLADLYLIFRFYLACDDQSLKQTALFYACKAVLYGLEGSNLLISMIVANIECNSIETKGGKRLSKDESIATMMAVSVISSYCQSIELFDKKVESKAAMSLKSVKSLEGSPLAVFVAVLLEEAASSRCDVIDKAISLLVSGLRERKITDIYSLVPLYLFFDELEGTKPGTVSKILDGLLSLLELRAGEDDKIFASTVELAADFLIYSARVIDTSPAFARFEAAIASWHLKDSSLSQEMKERLYYTIAYFSANYRRFPAIDPSTTPCKAGLCFGSSQYNILRLNSSEITSDLPVGRFTWTFKPIEPELQEKSLSENAKIISPIPSISENETQKKFEEPLSEFSQKLFSEILPSFGINSSPFKAEDASSGTNFTVSDSDIVEIQPQKAQPNKVGPTAAAFMSSLNFFDVMQTSRLMPTSQADFSEQMKPIDANIFRRKMHVEFVSASTMPSHFLDFKEGLGLLDKDTSDIVYTDCKFEVIFHAGTEKRQTAIIWTEGMTEEQIMASYSPQNQIRIEIEPMNSGLYSVKVIYSKEVDVQSPMIPEIISSKKALPLYVIGQVISNNLIITQRDNELVGVFQDCGAAIQKSRGSDFFSHPIPMICAKNLLSIHSEQEK